MPFSFPYCCRIVARHIPVFWGMIASIKLLGTSQRGFPSLLQSQLLLAQDAQLAKSRSRISIFHARSLAPQRIPNSSASLTPRLQLTRRITAGNTLLQRVLDQSCDKRELKNSRSHGKLCHMVSSSEILIQLDNQTEAS